MGLTTGTRLGPYEIAAPIGAGGMGEVYRAKDTRLNRDVAIKVLPASFAADPDRRARFEREAQAVAALSHPNVISIFDTGLHDGQLYVVMELLEGETLRERLSSSSNARGAPPPLACAPALADSLSSRGAAGASALSVRKATDIAVQIARGLGAAHGKGIVHRDLKPENIFLLEDGRVKILDFGLAKGAAGSKDPASIGPGETQTVAAMTDPGTVMGTVGYMAPEQVRGQAVDARADLFAFGAVLYEMMSGQRAFERDTAADTMTAILTQDPPELTGSRPDLSPALDKIIRHCLEKNANERFQNARDIAFALETLSGTAPSGASASASASQAISEPGRSRRRGIPILMTAGLVLAALAAGAYLGSRLVGTPPPITFEPRTFDAAWITSARFAADGKTVVFSAALAGNTPDLFVMRPGSKVAQRVGPPHTELLSVSSKDELAVLIDVHFIQQRLFAGTLARMTLDGAPRKWLEDVREADWSPDGSKLAIVHAVGSTDQLEYPAGTVLHKASGYLSDVRVAQDGVRVAFLEHPFRFDDRGVVKVVDGSGHVLTVTREFGGMEGLAWSADGRSLLFSAGDNGYSPLIVNVSGTPEVRAAFPSEGNDDIQDVASSGQVLVGKYNPSNTVRALLPGASAEREFAWLNCATSGLPSRDGRVLLFTDYCNGGLDYDLYLRGADGSAPVRIGAGFGQGLSADGQWALALIPSKNQLMRYPTGAGEAVPVDRGSMEHYRIARWFPDGQRILACGNEPSRPLRCYVQPVGGGPPSPVTSDNVTDAVIAPDGKRLLVSIASGAKEVVELGSTAGRPVPSIRPSDWPIAWSNDGRSVFVQADFSGRARIERVDLGTGARTFLRELAPPDVSGVTSVNVTQWSDDGRAYAYYYTRQLSQLFVVTGVK